jgi:histidinol dehydrogenase
LKMGDKQMLRVVSVKDDLVSRLRRREHRGEDLEAGVREIIEQVRDDGDQGVLAATRKFDHADLKAAEMQVTEDEIRDAYAKIPPDLLESLRLAGDNIRAFHARQHFQTWFQPGNEGELLGQIYSPLERVGIYVPGGTAAYPSSVLMNAIPAKAAGVKEIVMVTPPASDGTVLPLVLAAAVESGVTKIFKAGGVQAVAALAYGTESVPKVDKIVGPGNIYVTIAKRLVFGLVDIDMLAGPSEIVVVADQDADPVLVAADLLSQAEHDRMAAAILVTPEQELALKVQGEVEKQLDVLPRRDIASAALDDYGAAVVTSGLEEAIDLVNELAPEHLELYVADPFSWLGRIRNAGAVFLGAYAAEPVGDYFAGPDHVLPTGGTARFFSPLSVEDFLKRTSVIYTTKRALQKWGPHIMRLAEYEGLDAHARAVAKRLER